MATEKLEIDVVVNGQKAKVELDGVDQKINDIGNTTEEASAKLNTMISSIKTGSLALGATLSAAFAKGVYSAIELNKNVALLSASMRQYVADLSSATGVNQEIIAGFVQSGEAANLSAGTIKTLAEQAIALGRAFPHESAESFMDNLIMLNTSGEAQGFIVDILEQKYGALDLKTISLADKMATVAAATDGVNEKFQKTAESKLDILFTSADNALTLLGQTALSMINNWGWIDAVQSGMDTIIRQFKEINQYNIKDVTVEMSKVQADLAQAKKDLADPAFYQSEVGLAAEVRLLEQRLTKLTLQKKTLEEEVQVQETARLKDIEVAETKIQNVKNVEAATKASANAKASAEKDAAKVTADAEKEKQQAIEESQRAQERYIDDLSHGIADMVTEGKFNFKDMLRSWINDFLASGIKELLSELWKSIAQTTVIKSALGFFGLHTGTTKVMHTGGHVPSYHTGIRTDERMAKLQVGEAVINRAGASINRDAIDRMNRGESVGGGAVQQTVAEINFNVQAIDSTSFNSYLVNNRATIENIINKSLTTNGSVRRTIKQTV